MTQSNHEIKNDKHGDEWVKTITTKKRFTEVHKISPVKRSLKNTHTRWDVMGFITLQFTN